MEQATEPEPAPESQNARERKPKEQKKKEQKQRQQALSLLDVRCLRGVVDGDVSAVRASLDSGSNPNSTNMAGQPLLCIAAGKGHAAVVALLLQRGGADAHVREPGRGSSALAIAAEFGHAAVIDTLIGQSADVASKDVEGATALHVAAANGQPRAIERLVAHSAPLDALTDKGLTPLFYAAQMDRKDCCRILLEAGADPDIITPWGTAYERAKDKGHEATAAVLRYMPAALYAKKRKTRPDFRPVTPALSSSMSELVKAAGVGDVALVARLLDRRANINEHYHAYPAISIAAGAGNAAVVALLAERGANTNAPALDGSTALHTAASGGHSGVVEVLIGSCAPVDVLTKQGISPLYMAAWNGHLQCVQALLEGQADYRLGTKWGTALSVAQDEGHSEVAALLRKHAEDAAAAEDQQRKDAAAAAAAENPTLPPCDGTLKVVVHKCSNLLAGDRNGLSDPFVTLALGECSVKTLCVKKTLDPVFDEVLELPIATSETDGLRLVATVWDQDLTTHDFLGEAKISLCDEFASDGWLASSINGEYSLGDPDERLGGSERKQAQERTAAGIMRPLGTLTLRIEFVPDHAQMQAAVDAAAAATAALAHAEAEAAQKAKHLAAAKAAAAIAADLAAKQALVDSRTARLSRLMDQPTGTSVSDNTVQETPDETGVGVLSSTQRPHTDVVGMRASPDIHPSSGQIRARKGAVRRLPTLSVGGLAEVALGHKFATKAEIRAAQAEKDRAAHRAAKFEERKAQLAAEKERERAERAADIPDYSKAPGITPVEYLLEYRQSSGAPDRPAQEGFEQIVVSLAIPSVQELQLPVHQELLTEVCLRHANDAAHVACDSTRGGDRDAQQSRKGTEPNDDSRLSIHCSSIEVNVVGYADPWFEIDQVRFAKALARLEAETERVKAVIRHRESFLRQTEQVHLEELLQMSVAAPQTCAECWEALSAAEEAQLANEAAAADQSELFDVRQSRKELQLQVTSRSLKVYRDGQCVEELQYPDLSWAVEAGGTLRVEHPTSVRKYWTDRSTEIEESISARVQSFSKVIWKTKPAGALFFRLRAKGILLRTDWTVQSRCLTQLRSQLGDLDADLANVEVRGAKRDANRQHARRLHEKVTAVLIQDALLQLGLEAEDLLAGVAGTAVGYALAKELIEELMTVGRLRLQENDGRHRLDAGKGVKRADVLEAQRVLSLAERGLSTFLGASHVRTLDAKTLLASSFCSPSLTLAPLDDLRIARMQYNQLVSARHAKLTAAQASTGLRQELLELRVVFLGDKIKKIGPEHIDAQAVDAAYGLDDMDDMKAALVDLLLAHYVRVTARDDAETLRYHGHLDPVVAEIKQRQHVVNLLEGLMPGAQSPDTEVTNDVEDCGSVAASG